MKEMIEFIRKHKLEEEVDLVTCDTVDTCMTEGAWAWVFQSYENFKNAGGNVSKLKIHQGDDAKKVFSNPLLDFLFPTSSFGWWLCSCQCLKFPKPHCRNIWKFFFHVSTSCGQIELTHERSGHKNSGMCWRNLLSSSKFMAI